MKGKIAAGVVVVLVGAGLAVNQTDVKVVCGPQVSTPLVIRGISASKAIGKTMAYLEHGQRPGPESMFKTIWGGYTILEMWGDQIKSSWFGVEDPELSKAWQARYQIDFQRAVDSCCPTETVMPDNPDVAPAPPEPPPWDPKSASLQLEQKKESQSAILTKAVAVRKAKNLPAEADLIIAITGLVESEIRNLDHGDRDSLGWLQQRPSQGWGSAAQVQDVTYASATFFDHLIKVDNWQTRPPGNVAQAVQISAFPDRYAKRIPDAKRLLAGIGAGEVAPAPDTTPNVNCAAQSAGAGDLNSKTATWNVLKSNSPGNVKAGVRAMVAAGADIIGGQELGDESLREAFVSASAKMRAIDLGSAVPILYDADVWTLTASGEDKALDEGEKAEAWNGDGGNVGPKYVTWATLKSTATGRSVSVVNTHMLVGWKNGPKRSALYLKQVGVAMKRVDALKASGNPVLVTGDWNASEVPSMAQHGLTSSLTKATHGKRTTDRVYSTGATPTGHVIGTKNGSDHSWVIATFEDKSEAVSDVPTSTEGGASPAIFNQLGNPRTVEQTMAFLTKMSSSKTPIAPNMCSRYVARAYGWSNSGSPTAISLWGEIPSQYKHPGLSDPPRGALVFWRTKNSARHIAISAGGGKIFSTDVPKDGTWGVIALEDIDRWGPRIGWAAPFWPAHSHYEGVSA